MLVDVVLAALLIITGLFTIYYWVDFFTKGGVHVVKEEWYIKFEKAFPVADAWMAACALLGAAGLLGVVPRAYGQLFALLAASSLIFLGLADVTFNVENKLYGLVATSRQMALELVINLWCLLLGAALIAYLAWQIV